MNDLFSVKNKIVIITGSGKGIGMHLATSIAEHGAYVYAIDKLFKNSFKKKSPPNLFQVKCDVSNRNKFQKICKKIFIKHKKIDVLINNAGISRPLKKEQQIYPEKDWLETIKINLTASFNCSQAVIEYMCKNNHGSIINITSINAERGFPRNPSYVASKGGLKMLGKALAKDWGKCGIRVNNIGPGYIKTDMTKKTFSNKKTRIERSNHTLLGRWGLPKDLVGPCIFLASDASSYITGQDIYVDGGWLANSLITE